MVANMNEDNPSTTDVSCPSCGADVSVELTLLLTPGSEALKALFEGGLNTVECGECEDKFVVSAPLIYRDDQEKFLVYYMPLQDRNAWHDMEEQVSSMGERAFAGIPLEDRPQCRLTFHRRNFIEKIAAHTAGLDDKLLEYVKYQLYSRPEDPIDQIRCELLYDFSGDNSERLGFLIFDRETGQPTAAAHIPRSTFDELCETFAQSDGLQKELSKLFPGPYVSVERLYD